MITRILQERSIGVHYQPIVELNGDLGAVHGYEALARPSRPGTPDRIFREAGEAGLTGDLDVVCVENAVRRFPNGATLFINVYPSTLKNPAPLLRAVEGHPGYVFEILEREKCDPRELRRMMDGYRREGMHFAANDISPDHFGSKTAESLKIIEPDYIKLDLKCTQGMGSDPSMEQFAYFLKKVAGEIGSKVIAEGVENDNHLRDVQRAGLDYAQGFLVDRRFPPYDRAA